jgi:small subunit ribosomal protein S18
MLNRKKVKICKFCENKDNDFNYMNEKKLRHFITERGKIIPRRMSRHMRKTSAKTDNGDQACSVYGYSAVYVGDDSIDFDRPRDERK